MRGMRGGIGRVTGAALAALAVVTAAHLGAQLRGAGAVADATQIALMPLLFLALLAGTRNPRGRLVELFALGLVLSWMGDTLPRFLDGQDQFLAMLAGFLLAQTVYAIALWPLRRRSLLGRSAVPAPDPARSSSWSPPAGPRTGEASAGGERAGAVPTVVRRAAVIPYLGAAAVIVWLCAPSAGALLPALVVYAAAICTMAVLATGLGPRGGVGGALFVVSDGLIALDTFDALALPAHAVWVMATYVAAQVLLVLGVLAHHARARPWSTTGAGRSAAAI